MYKNKKLLLVDLLLIIIILVFVYTSYRLCKTHFETIKINGLLISENDDNYKLLLTDLKKKNKDIIGILEIENTEYKTFFVKGKDNKEYLIRNIYKKKDKNGTPFLDYRVNMSSKKLVIYGHNSSYINMPFDFLENYYNKDFYIKNRTINIKTVDEIQKYEVVSVFTETSDWSYQKVKFDSDSEYEENINKLIDKSIYKEASKYKDEQILVLQTCSTKEEYKKYSRKFLIIVARRIK